MPLVSPRLDDRTFEQLVTEALERVRKSCPEWTDLTPGDPGVMLLELIAYATETMLFRLNQVPDKVYVELLRLIGVTLQPPAAAIVALTFTRTGTGTDTIEIPQGTRVAASRAGASGDTPVFTTVTPARIPAGASETTVRAVHATEHRGELLGVGDGAPGSVVRVAHPPIIASGGDGLELVLGVETGDAERREGALEWEGKSYRIWRAVPSFAERGDDGHVYTVDRLGGTITFAPAVRAREADGSLVTQPVALGEKLPPGREVRAWYRTGGGGGGNVSAGMLTTLRDPIPGVSVTNLEPAIGGRDAETLENALLRGPQELYSLERAVTARDFERIALRCSGAVERARAVTSHDIWKHAQPGTVDVLLVPRIPPELCPGGRLGVETLLERQTADAREAIQRALDARRPLGVTVHAAWGRYKVVNTSVRVVIHREEDPVAVKRRVEQRLYETISPLAGPTSRGWAFGEALRASHVYDIVLREPGVLFADQVRLSVNDVPDAPVSSLVPDRFQARTWFAGSGDILFRSSNDGEGWEPAGRFGGQHATLVRVHAARPGLVAVVSEVDGEDAGTIHVSRDLGESWEEPARLGFTVRDAAWLDREGVPALLLATDAGLYELPIRPGATPVQLVVDPAQADQGYFAVAVATEVRGQVTVAVAAQRRGGIYLSTSEGRSETFQLLGLEGEDIRTLAVQYDGPRTFLWSGVYAASPDDPGKGCFRRELVGTQQAVQGWQAFSAGWTGGNCESIAFDDATVLAASHHQGVMGLNLREDAPTWSPPDIRCGLPFLNVGAFLFKPVLTVDVSPGGLVILAGGDEGVFRSSDRGVSYQRVSTRDLAERVTLPSTWLFCSGDHDVMVVNEDEAASD